MIPAQNSEESEFDTLAALARPECPFCRVHFRPTAHVGTSIACRVCNRPLVPVSADHGQPRELSDAESLTMLNEFRVSATREPMSGSGPLARMMSTATVPAAPPGFDWVFVLRAADTGDPHFIGWPFSEGEAEDARARRGVWAGFDRTLYYREPLDGRVREPAFRF